MPRIVPGDPLLAGFDPSTPLALPGLFGPEWGIDVADFKKAAWADANYQQWSQVTKRVVSHIGLVQGVPSWSVGGFGTFFEQASLVSPNALLSSAIGGAAKLVSLALAEATTAIPILGWIVELGLALFEGIKFAIEFNKDRPQPPGEAIEFSRDGNEIMASNLISSAKESDWTTLFMPPSTSGRWTMERVTWTPGGNGEGWAFGTPDEGGWGLIPGLAECVGTLTTVDRYTNYQFPDRSPVSLFGAEYDVPPTSTTGALRPSARQISVLLWQALMKPSVSMFQIDPFAIVSAWADYYMGLDAFAETLKTTKGVENVTSGKYVARGNNPRVPYNIAKIATTYLSYRSTEDGGITFASPETVKKYDTSTQIAGAPKGVSLDKLTSVIGNSLTYTYADLVKYVARVHFDRSLAALETIVCAYVPPDAPLLRASPMHREKWLDMRKRLLDHKALGDVELDLIPDAEYRAEVRPRYLQMAGAGFKADGITDGKPIRTPPGSAPTVDGGPQPDMPESPGPGLPQRPGKPSAGVGGWLGPAVGVLAVTAAGALVVRQLTRKR